MRIAIIGNGIVANMAALYLSKRFGRDHEIFKVGPSDREGLPLVGESTIEITAHFLEKQLGLGAYLRDQHLPKYALTYYFKLRPDDSADRRYSVHCNLRAPEDLRVLPDWQGPMTQPPSWQLNRFTFDRDLRTMVADTGMVTWLEGLVTDVDIREAGHTLHITAPNGQQSQLQADWVIDAGGRKCLLGRKMGILQRPEIQKDVFWFRLAGADRTILTDLDALGPMPDGPEGAYHYDRYYSTHHFMGKGNWIWMIPMKQDDGRHIISIGITSQPAHFEGKVHSITDFLHYVDRTHPLIGRLVRSGEVLDTNVMKRYQYSSLRVYDPMRWAVVGDAAFSPDALFSNGLAFSSIQLEQVGQLITMDAAGAHDPEFVQSLSDAVLGPYHAGQSAISQWYDTMHDPFVSAIRLHAIEIAYFYILLPLVVNRCHYDPQRLAIWQLLQNTNEDRPFEIDAQLLEQSPAIGEAEPAHFVYEGKSKVNLRALEEVRELRDLLEMGIQGAKLRQAYTQSLLLQLEKLQEVG